MGVVTCIKYTMVILNALLMLVGLFLIGFGIYKITDHEISWGSYSLMVLIGIGFAIFLTTLCGCVGGLMTSYCLLLTNTIFTFVLMTFSTVATVVIFVYKKQFASYRSQLVGCYNSLYCENMFEAQAELIGYIFVVTAFIELLMAMIGIFVTNQVQRGKRRVS